jgi:uncharacterized membrane protein YeaQ/YmgE (transglycosylase-associated protein family)
MDWSVGNIIWIIIGGAIIGVIARLLLRGRQSIPFWAVIIAGIIGMFVGDWLSSLIGVKETFGFDWIRHGLQLLVGVGAVAVLSAVFGRFRSTGGGSRSGAGAVGAGAAGAAAVAGAAATSPADAPAGGAAAVPEAVTEGAEQAASTVADAASDAGSTVSEAVADAGSTAADAAGDAASQIVPPGAQ